MKYLLYILITVILIWLNLKSGSTGWSDFGMLDWMNGSLSQLQEKILMEIRLPAVLTAIFAGAGLAISGLLMQVLFQNPLAGPGVMGISSGASLAVSISILAGIGAGLGLAITAIIGASVVLAIIILASLRLRSQLGLLILGLMIGYIISSLVTILQFTAQAERLQQFVFWTMGGFHSVDWSGLYVLIPVVFIMLTGIIFLSSSLDILLLGEEQMKSLGQNPMKWRVVVLLITGVLVGVITAYCGPLAFLGLAAPHVARMFTKSDMHGKLIIHTLFVGAIISLLALWIVSAPWIPVQLPLNAVLSIFGAPVVIWILVKSPYSYTQS